MQKVAKIVEILAEQRSIQFIFDEKLFFDVRRQFPFTIEGTTRHQMNQKKGERDHAKKNDHQADPSFGNKAEHGELSSAFGVRSLGVRSSGFGTLFDRFCPWG